MFRRIDRSPALARWIERLSGTMAKRRGLPVLLGVLLIAVSFVVSLVNVSAQSQTLDLVWSITHHLGLLIALVGFLLVEPLGR